MAVFILEASMICPHQLIERTQVCREKCGLPSVNLVRVWHCARGELEVLRSKD